MFDLNCRYPPWNKSIRGSIPLVTKLQQTPKMGIKTSQKLCKTLFEVTCALECMWVGYLGKKDTGTSYQLPDIQKVINN